MKDKKSDKPVNVVVHGKLTGHLDNEGAEHQVYRYHININSPDKAAPREYDNEIHIFKSVKQASAQAANSVSSEPSTPEVKIKTDVPPASKAKKPKLASARSRQLSGLSELKARLMQPVYTTRDSIKQVPIKLGGLIQSFIKPVVSLPRFKLSIPSIGFKNPFKAGLLQPLRNRPTRTKKPPTKTNKTTSPQTAGPGQRIKTAVQLLTGKAGSRKGFIRFCLPCILLTLLAISIYFLTDIKTKEKIIYPIEPVSQKPIAKTAKDYRAVIEKTGDGVVITLQGPDHEEVLTKLPPGYDPVVEGNKIVHVVTPGNTLWFIAMRYIKNPYRYPELARLNNIKNPDLIFPGEKVIIQYIRKP